MSSTVEDVLGEIVNPETPLRNSSLAELTDLGAADMELFKSAWARTETERRRKVASRLVELAMDNVEFNFGGIFRHFLADEDEEVRSQGIEGLWEDEDISLVRPLLGMLLNDRSEKVQAEAAAALARFTMLAEQGNVRPAYVARMQSGLLAVAGDGKRSLRVRRRALEAVAPLSVPEVKAAILAAYHSDEPELVVGAIYAMGKNCDPSWLPVLLDELSSDNAELRYEAASACGEMEDQAAVPQLVALVGDLDADVRLAAIGALGKIGSNEARRCLEKSLKSEQEAVRQAARDALREIAFREDPLALPNWNKS